MAMVDVDIIAAYSGGRAAHAYTALFKDWQPPGAVPHSSNELGKLSHG